MIPPEPSGGFILPIDAAQRAATMPGTYTDMKR